MESQDERQIQHPPVHENHGVHVCHKCGWAFPNPHPSAKHRRAHKKVCGKIEGFKLVGSEEKSNSDSDYDEDHKSSSLGEKVSGIVAEGMNKSEEDVFSDAVMEFADAESRLATEGVMISNTMSPPNVSTHDDQIHNLHASEGKTDHLDGSIPLQDHMLHSSTDSTGASISDKKINVALEPTLVNSSVDSLLSSVSPLEPKTPTNDSLENAKISIGEDVNGSVAVVGPYMDAEANGESTESTTQMVPVEVSFSSDFTNNSTISSMNGSSKNTVIDLNSPDATIFNALDEKANILGQKKPQSEMSPRTQPTLVEFEAEAGEHLVEVEAGEHLVPSVDTHQVSKGSLLINSRVEVDETTAENLPVYSTLEDIPSRNITEMKSDACKDQMPLKTKVTPTLTGVEELESKEVLCSGPVLEEANSGFMSIKSGERADVFPTTVQVQEDDLEVDGPGSGSMSKELIIDQSGADEDLNDEGSQSIGIHFSECVAEELKFDGLATHSDSSKAFALNDSVMGSSEVDATQSNSKDNKQASSLGESEPHHGFSHEILPQTSPISGGSIMDFVAETEVYQEVTTESGGYDVVHEETGVDATQSHLEYNKQASSLGESEPHHGFSHEILPESLPISGGSITEFSAETEEYQEITKESGGYDAVHGETSEDATQSYSVDNKPVLSLGEMKSPHGFSIEILPETGVDTAQSHSEDNKPASFLGELEPHHGFSLEILSETSPISGGITDFASETEVYKEITKENGEYDVVHEETGTDHASIVKDYTEEGTTDGKSLSSSLFTPAPANNVTEMKAQFFEDAGMNDAEATVQLTEGTHADTAVGSKGLNYSSLENISDNHSDLQNHHNAVFQESSKEIAADSFSIPSVLKTEKEFDKIETDSGSQEKLDRSTEDGLCQVGAQNSTPEELVSLAVDTESCVQSSFTPDNSSTKDLTDGDACEGGDTILKQDASASVFTVDASVDSISQTDSVEGYWGSVSDGTIASTRDATDRTPILSTAALPDIDVQTPKEASTTNSKKQSPAGNTDIFEPPSFMTLVEPNKGDNGQQAATEIQSVQNPQCPGSPTSQTGLFPSLMIVANESQERNKNEEIISKVVNWSSEKPHIPLRSLLVDANLEGKHKASPTTPEHRSPKTHEGPAPEVDGAPAKTALEVSAMPAAANEATEKEWNSPARLPVIKREKRKVRGYWAQFVCCSSIN